jgi:TonB family protein
MVLGLALPGTIVWVAAQATTAEASRDPSVERRVAAEYPEWARGTGIATTVDLRVQVGKDGRARRVLVEPYTVTRDILTRRLRASFDSAAVACAQRWSFRPARRDGRPAVGWIRVGVTFEDPGPDPLHDPRPPATRRAGGTKAAR